MDRNEIKKTVTEGIRDFFSTLFSERNTEPARLTAEQFEQRVQQGIEVARKPLADAIDKLSAQFAHGLKEGHFAKVAARNAVGEPADAKKHLSTPFGLVDASTDESINMDTASVADQAREHMAQRKKLGMPVSATEAVAHVIRSGQAKQQKKTEFAENEENAELAEKTSAGNMLRNSARIAARAKEFREERRKAGVDIDTTEAVQHVMAESGLTTW